ncbi:MAG: HEAT repeat domain-containing protein [Verrucomicrobiales bacterium]|nr:HEAT repeat domain-containing protein [Verrucomicrobiales bacterium]
MNATKPIVFALAAVTLSGLFLRASAPTFLAGASTVDVSPVKLPAIRNGGFLQAVWSRNSDPLYARSLVLDDGKKSIVLCVVDSCMLPTDVCDAIKTLVTEQTGIPRDQFLISATHTHSAPSTMAMCLGTSKDEAYTEFLIPKVAQGITNAWEKRKPARAGWTAVDASEFTNCRRWINRSDKTGTDPFGNRTVRAMMHPGYENPNTTGPAGPIDPELSIFSVVSADTEKPIAAFTNFSMHYYGAGGGFSADYFGEMAKNIETKLGDGAVAIVSQGTSGDLHWMDYSRPKRTDLNRNQYAEQLSSLATKAISGIKYRDDISLNMAERRILLKRRTPSPERLAWAAPINQARETRPEAERPPKDRPEVYAQQAEWIANNAETEVVLQAIRIGDLAIAALPNEVYGITGLKLKAQSPFDATFNIELANGAEGYIPPPEQHALGGYTTWPARTAGLEVEAEPKFVAHLLELFEEVTGQPARALADSHGPYAKAVLADKPFAYWRLDDIQGPDVRDAVGKPAASARFENGVALHLPGVQKKGGAISTPPEVPSPFSGPEANRAAHFAGGRIASDFPDNDREYSVSFWFWNSFPTHVRPVTAYLFSRGKNGDKTAIGEHLGIGGTVKDTKPGRLFFYTGNGIGEVVNGKTELAFRDWHHVALVRNKDSVRVYLNGKPEIEAKTAWTLPDQVTDLFIGGRCDNFANFEGKIDEVSIFSNALSEKQIAEQFGAAERTAPTPPAAPRESDPLEPAAAIQTLRVPEGFSIDLIASEPQLLDPVAFDWDTRGRLWVVEMADYPLGLGDNGAAGGRIRVLEDRDKDGSYEHSALFADGLNFPNGIITWRDGVIVTAAPDVIFLRDTTGDGTADQREVLLTGLTEGNQQLRANGLRWGLDNWVYVAAGGHHGKHGVNTRIHSSRAGTEVKIGSRDFRFRPDTGEVEAQSGPTQFGRNRDDWGNWFGTQNSRPLWHYVLPDHYLSRNPHYASPEGRVLLPGKVSPPVFPAKPPQKRFHGFDQSGHFTSACSGMIYRDEKLFPTSPGTGTGWNNLEAFTCEPFHNLVQHISVTRKGPSFEGKRTGAEGEPDFLAGTDRWFRPVMTRTGPDGALWVADMYRYMIEHPHWLPEEGKAALLPHYREGDDRGRIYRVRRSRDAVEPVPDLANHDLVESLSSPNGWVRDKAQQLILWQNNKALIPRIKEQVSINPDPRTRVQALATLNGLGALEESEILMGLTDEHPGVRSNALRLAETKPSPAIVKAVLNLAADPDAAVRLQCAFTLGEMPPSKQAAEALAKYLRSDDAFTVAAASSSILPHFAGLVSTCPNDAPIAYRRKLAEMALSLDRPEDFQNLAKPLLSTVPNTLALLDLLKARGLPLTVLEKGPELKNAFAAILGNARQVLNSESADFSERINAASLLSRNPADQKNGLDFLSSKISAATAPDDFAQVLAALRSSGGNRVSKELLNRWRSLSPSFRDQVTELLLSKQDWTNHFLLAVENGDIRPTEVSPTVKSRLAKHPNKTTRVRATSLLESKSGNLRAEVVATYTPALKQQGDSAKGLVVFQKACLACHKRGKAGFSDLGPDLATVVDHPVEKLLANILDPNLDIQPGYHAYNCELNNGEQLFGLIAGETASGITLKQLDGKVHHLLRTDIKSLVSANTSLMPEGLEAAITIEEMADLIAYLKSK